MYYAVEDNLIMRNFLNKIREYPAKFKFFPEMYRKEIGANPNVFFFSFVHQNPEKRFSTDCSQIIYWGSTITYVHMQLAYYMGCNPVYLIGMGHIRPDNQQTHFVLEEEYYKGKRFHTSNWNRVFGYYGIAREAFESDGREILNATPINPITNKPDVPNFDLVDYYSLFRR